MMFLFTYFLRKNNKKALLQLFSFRFGVEKIGRNRREIAIRTKGLTYNRQHK